MSKTPLNQKELISKLNENKSVYGEKVLDVDFSGHHFDFYVDFRGLEFLQGAKFSGSPFKKGADFTDAIFTENADFTNSFFRMDADFKNARFNGGVSFYHVQFYNEVSFMGASFSGEGKTCFQGTQFDGNVTFEKAQFSGKKGVDFSEARFLNAGVAKFNLIKHSGEGEFNFYKTKFLGSNGTFFSGAEFLSDGNVYFHNTIFNKKCLIRLDQIQTKNPKNVKFINVDLGNISFYQTDIEEFRFNNVTFGKIDILICDSDRVNRFIRRIINQLFALAETKGIKKLNALRDKFNSFFLQRISLADEELDGQQGAYDNSSLCGVEILYRKLKYNFEEQREYARAGDFHYGEMEMRRKQKSRWLQVISLILPYRIISGYGEKWGQSLTWFLGLWLFFSLPNILLIQPKGLEDSNKCTQSLIKCSNVSFRDSLFFTLNTMTFKKDPYFKPKNSFVARGSNHFLSLIGIVIIALMLLAIRRQYKR